MKLKIKIKNILACMLWINYCSIRKLMIEVLFNDLDGFKKINEWYNWELKITYNLWIYLLWTRINF